MTERTTPPLSGGIPRIEHQQAHHDFLQAVEPPAAMINMVHARRLLKAGETASSWFPDRTDVVTTTTFADNKLAKFKPRQEAAMVKAFAPDYHIPTDFPVYGEFDADRRFENTRRAASGTLWMAKRLPDDVTLLPLIKGTTPDERKICAAVVDQLDAPMAVKYGVQYFTVGGNGQLPALAADLQAISNETNDVPMLVIGPMSAGNRHGVQKYPDNVWAAAGLNAWVKRVEPRSNTPQEMRDAYNGLAEDVADGLDVDVRYTPDDTAAVTPPATSAESSQG